MAEVLTAGEPSLASEGVMPSLTVVMPCLNERDTVGTCVRKALAALRAANIPGEVLVADNGSHDGSQAEAERLGARVVPVSQRGYGSALQGGISAARGEYILMGDADDSYDFGEIPRFYEQLLAGADLVQGCRLPAGGGKVMPNAMPWLHRWIGNPGLTWLSRLMFGAPIHDVYCGMRAFRKDVFEGLNVHAQGMEFATEMIIKATLFGGKICEVPITLWPDGRVNQRPHLRTFRDGWRTLRLFLIYSPRWLFWYPGLLLMLLGLVGYALALPGVTLRGVSLDAHTLVVASMMLLVGLQAAGFAIVTTGYSVTHGYRPWTPNARTFFRLFTLELGIVVSGLLQVLGVGLLALATWRWGASGFGRFDFAAGMRLVVPGATLIALGTCLAMISFLNAVVGVRGHLQEPTMTTGKARKHDDASMA